MFMVSRVRGSLFRLLQFRLPIASDSANVQRFAFSGHFRFVGVLSTVISRGGLSIATRLRVSNFSSSIQIGAFCLYLGQVTIK